MATYLGPADLKNRVLPTGWDATELEKRRTASNITLDQITTEVSNALAAVNRELLTDPLFSMMYGVTTEPTVEYRMGSTNDMVRMPEYAPVAARRGVTEGHMLPLLDWVYPLEWTWKYLQRCRRQQVEADIQGLVDAVRNRFYKSMLTRFFKQEDDSGVNKLLGSAGYSPGFAHTAGSTSVDYVPPDYGGQAFANTHEHYNYNNGHVANDWDTALNAAARHLAEHGHMPPYVMLCAREDQATVMGLTDFRERAQPEIQYGGSVDLARVNDLYFGAYVTADGSALCTWSDRIPQYYFGLFKAYPQGNPRNSLAVLYTNDHPLVTDLIPGAAYTMFPLEGLIAYSEFGIGVRDRTNGVCYYLNSGSYTSPTIT